MPTRAFDTSWLISHWHQYPKQNLRTVQAMRDWARELIGVHFTNYILTPVFVEMLAGTRDSGDLEIHLAYLGEFEVLDQHNIPPSDWRNAITYAKRVPRDGSSRQMGDCLIQAIADRCNCEMIAKDKWFASI